MRLNAFLVTAFAALLLFATEIVSAADAAGPVAPTAKADWSWETTYVVIILLIMMTALITEIAPATPAMVIASMMLYLAGIVSVTELFIGLMNNGVVSVAILFIIVKPMETLPAMKKLLIMTLSGSTGSQMWPLFKLIMLSIVISPFAENTPHVAMFTPLITKFCAENGLSAAQFLMPMDFAVIASNYAVVGAGSNLVISGLMEQYGLGAMNFFELGKGTVMVMPFLALYLVFTPKFLLPDHETIVALAPMSTSGLRIKLKVTERAKRVIGIETQELPNVMPGASKPEGFRLLAMYHEGKAVDYDEIPTTKFAVDDVFVIACNPKMVISTAAVLGLDFVTANENSAFQQVMQYRGQKAPAPVPESESNEPVGEAPADGAVVSIMAGLDEIALWEVVLSPNCPMVGSTIATQEFQRMYAAAILSVRMCTGNHDLPEDEMSSYRLAGGDTLLMLAHKDFEKDHQSSHDFLVITGYNTSIDTLRPFVFVVPPYFPFGELTNEGTPAARRVIMLPKWWPNLSFLIFIAIVVAAVFHIKLAVLCLGGAILYVLLGIMTASEAYKAIHVDVYIMLAFSFPLGYAVKNCGLASIIGQAINDAGISGFSLLLLIAAVTTIMTNAISNKATCQVMFPIAYEAAIVTGMDPLPAIVVMTMTAVYAFLTPYAIPPNILIFGPGGYRPVDYFKFGLPLAILMTILTPLSASIVYNVW